VTAIEGNDSVESLRLRDVQSGTESKLNVNGIFVAIGFTPNTTYLKDMVNIDSAGQIVVSQNMETNVPGLFAAGDIRSGSIRQVIAACADGATAAISADKYIEKNK